MENTVLIIGKDCPLYEELLQSSSLDSYNYFFFDSFEEAKKETLLLFKAVVILQDIDKSDYLEIKKYFKEQLIFIQHCSKTFFRKSDLVLTYDFIFSNYGDNLLNDFFIKIHNNENIIADDSKLLSPICTYELEICLTKVLDSNVKKGIFLCTSKENVTISHFYNVVLTYSGIPYKISRIMSENKYSNVEIILKTNELFENTFDYKFQIFEKTVLNTLRARKYYPIILGDFYNLYDTVYMIRYYNKNDDTVKVSPINDMNVFENFSKNEFVAINRI